MMFNCILIIFITGVCITTVTCQTSKVVKYKLAGRNMLEYNNLFFEVDKDRGAYCRSESISGNDNPEWRKECWVTFSGDTSQYLKVNIRNDISLSPDESIGWGIVHVKNMLEEGQIIRENIWRDDGYAYRGYITIRSEQVTIFRQSNGTTNVPI